MIQINWPLIYKETSKPLWYRVNMPTGIKYIMLVKMDDTLVSMPYFSYANLQSETPEKVEDAPVFDYDGKIFSCQDPDIQWHLRLLTPVSGHYHKVKVVSWLSLPLTPDEQFARFSSNVRRKINKATKNNIKIEIGGSELVNKFYSVFSHNMHRLGAPAMSKNFYKRVVDAFGHDGSVLIAKHDGKAIGGAIMLKRGKYAEVCWFATLEDYSSFYTSYFLWWECIKLAIKRKSRVFSFGRSTRNSGSHYYKQQWGVRNTTLYWSFSYPLRNDRYPIAGLNILMPNRNILSFLWKISPCFVIRWLGPMVADQFY
ncbi:MAG: peptidoglycan bridge formation glycyltransferase FemA/FemB family protein [Lentimicrobiaceae bacterium]|nr:peptidoglycan bridge formation glycyltransferase FemA/FemB family protein [Lentimicrobiaceae bacterium]